MVSIDSVSNPNPPVYTDENTAVDARANDRYVEWNTGFDLSADFTASLWGRDFNENSDIITMIDDIGNNLVVRYRTNNDGTVYADLTVTNSQIIYYIYSASISAPTDSQKVQFWFRRIGYQYEIRLEVDNSQSTTGSDTLTWDGNTEGRVSAADAFYKVSDATPTMTDFANGATLVFNAEGEIETISITTGDIVDGSANGIPMLGVIGGFMVVFEDNVNMDITIWPEKGIYFVNDSGICLSSLTIPGYTGFPISAKS